VVVVIGKVVELVVEFTRASKLVVVSEALGVAEELVSLVAETISDVVIGILVTDDCSEMLEVVDEVVSDEIFVTVVVVSSSGSCSSDTLQSPASGKPCRAGIFLGKLYQECQPSPRCPLQPGLHQLTFPVLTSLSLQSTETDLPSTAVLQQQR